MSKTFLVGGAVRDKLLNYPYTEHDWVVVGSSPEVMLTQGFKPVGKDFPVFLHPKTNEEYALARTERKTAPGYSGFSFHTAPDITLEDDLKRRDLTINAIAEDSDGQLVDPYGGQRDIQERYLRHVSEAFSEDPVRVLRVARFAARYHHLGFRVADETQALMRAMVACGEVNHLVAERVWKEFEKALGEPSPSVFIKVLRDCGALAVLLPELDHLFDLPQPQHHNHGEYRLAALQITCELTQQRHIRFASLMNNTSEPSARVEQALSEACRRLATPKAYRDLALAVCRDQRLAAQTCRLDGAQLLSVLQRLDALRRPEKMQDFLVCCEAEQQLNSEGSTQPDQHPTITEHLQQALKLCLAVTAQDLVAEGLSGKAIGETLQQRRLEQLNQLHH